MPCDLNQHAHAVAGHRNRALTGRHAHPNSTGKQCPVTTEYYR